jgi:predicted ribosome quality control (RQC) complex YloA/Tae2 family protein
MSSSSTSSDPALTSEDISEFSDFESWETNVIEAELDSAIGEDDDSSSNSNQGTTLKNDSENGNPLEGEYWRLWNAVNDAIKTLDKKRNSLHSELSKARGAEDTMARAQLLVSNLYLFQGGVRRATVIDWENGGVEVELALDCTGKYESPSAEADALFAQARKLKRGSQVVADLLKETDKAWEILQEAKLDLQSNFDLQKANDDDNDRSFDQGRLALVKDRLTRTSRITKIQIPTVNDDTSYRSSSTSDTRSNTGGNYNKNSNQRERKPEVGSPASNIRKLLSPGGCVVLVGRNRRGNENLSLNIARGNDIWMHSRGCPGAHVLIQNRRGGPKPSEACLQFGADLAVFYSDMRNEKKADVTAAEPKHILKPRGAPLGAIKIREEWRTFVGRPDRVPDELKLAREGSGQTDEYHMSDKAKHRRRTKLAAEEERIKRKQQRKGQ